MGSKLTHFSLETLPALRVIGKTTRVKEPTTLEDPTIEQLWEGMFKDGDLAYLLSLPGRYSASADRVGWMGDFQPGDNAYTYLAGVLFDPSAPVPEGLAARGFSTRDIAAGLFATGWVAGDDSDEGGDMMANASGHLSQAREAHGYEYDGSRGFFEMEVYTQQRFDDPLAHGEQPVLDFYSPCIKRSG
jgi:hypothetical protein